MYNYVYNIYIYIFGETTFFQDFLAGEMSKIHQTDLKCKWSESDAVSLTKIEQYRLSAIVPSQIKSRKAARNDMILKTRILHQMIP